VVEEEEELPDLDQESGDSESNNSPVFGTSFVAVYEGQWFPAVVEEIQENVAKGYIKLSYASIKGTNCFAWGSKKDLMVTHVS